MNNLSIESLKRKFGRKYLNINFAGSLLWVVLRSIIICGISFMILYPFILKISASFMSLDDLLDSTVKYIPKTFSTGYLIRAYNSMDFMNSTFRTFMLSATVGLIQLFICSMVGYGFAKFNFKGKSLLFGLVMFALIIPPQTLAIPTFLRFRYFNLIFTQVNLIDSLWPFIILSLTGLGMKNGLYIYMMRQFFRGMPKELEESAYIDGSGPIKTFLLIIIPNAIPIMVTIFLFSFTWQWTDIHYSNMFFNNFSVLATSITRIAIATREDPIIFSTIRNTGSLLLITPLLFIYVLAQKFFIQSIERSGIVG